MIHDTCMRRVRGGQARTTILGTSQPVLQKWECAGINLMLPHLIRVETHLELEILLIGEF